MTVTAGQSPAVLAIFILTYLGMAVGRVPGLKLSRTGIALLGAIGMVLATRSSTAQVVSSVNWPTRFLLFGFFVVSAQLRLSGFYDKIAENISGRIAAPARFLVFLIAVTAGLSAFLNNDIVCYVLTPVVGAALIRKQINPVPFLVSLAIASNIGAGATLIGNAQNMMIGQLAGLSFLRYLLWAIVPIVFALAANYAVTRMGVRAEPPVPQAIDPEPGVEPFPFDRYHTIKGVVVLAAVIALFFTSLPRELVVLVAASIHLASTKYRTEALLSLVDWPVLLLFIGLFVVSGGFEATGYGDHLVRWLEARGFEPSQPAAEVALTAGLTTLINNAPAVMLLVKLLPVTQVTVANILAAANSLAGNAVLTASVANLIVVQQARRQGIVISFWDFARQGGTDHARCTGRPGGMGNIHRVWMRAARVPAALAALALCAGCQTARKGSSSVEMLEPLSHAQPTTDKKVTVERDPTEDSDPPEQIGELEKPVYPPAALAAHAGTYILYVTIIIDANGRVSEVTPSWDRVNLPSRYSEDFLAAVKTAAASWRFIPAHLVHWERHPNGTDRYLYSEIIPAQVDVRFTFEATGKVR